ncbi:hypothetical protein PR003_g27048 [Phytophthora rubi]|uniref:Uncharacterized protein n=1 Tax=Phytophthora rubi TaxID=129364 RepID=A0A6A4C781_9STRA|nr:hypothetical protein PR003_g27048 [Phytophthora rubi]
MPVRWLIDARTASRSSGGRATWIDDTEWAPEGAYVMGSRAAGPAEVAIAMLERRSSAWGRAARAPRRAAGGPPSEPEKQAVGAGALVFAAASTVDGVGDPAGDVATGAV